MSTKDASSSTIDAAYASDHSPHPRRLFRISKDTKGICILFAYLSMTFFLTHVNLSGTMLDYKNLPSQLAIVDKVYHFCAYSIMMFLVLFAFTKPVEGKSRTERQRSANKLIMWCVFVVLYGIFDECTQPYFGRNFEFLDMFANCVGIAAGQLAFVICEATGFREKLMKLM